MLSHLNGINGNQDNGIGKTSTTTTSTSQSQPQSIDSSVGNTEQGNETSSKSNQSHPQIESTTRECMTTKAPVKSKPRISSNGSKTDGNQDSRSDGIDLRLQETSKPPSKIFSSKFTKKMNHKDQDSTDSSVKLKKSNNEDNNVSIKEAKTINKQSKCQKEKLNLDGVEGVDGVDGVDGVEGVHNQNIEVNEQLDIVSSNTKALPSSLPSSSSSTSSNSSTSSSLSSATMIQSSSSTSGSTGSNGSTSGSPKHASLKHVKDLTPLISCQLCHGYLIDATTIVECLHSFCKTCLIKHLDNIANPNSNKCPVCDVQIHKTKPKLNIRSDPTLQDIVYKLVPGLFKNEMTRRKEFYSEHSESAIGLSSEERGEISGERLIFTPEDIISISLEYFPQVISYSLLPFSRCYGPNNNSNGSFNGVLDGVISNPDGSNPADSKGGDKSVGNSANGSQRRFLRCPGGMKVLHLKKFLKMKYDVKNDHEIEIMYKHDCLSDEYTMVDLAYIYSWRRNGPLCLYYKISEPFSAKKASRKIKQHKDQSLPSSKMKLDSPLINIVSPLASCSSPSSESTCSKQQQLRSNSQPQSSLSSGSVAKSQPLTRKQHTVKHKHAHKHSATSSASSKSVNHQQNVHGQSKKKSEKQLSKPESSDLITTNPVNEPLMTVDSVLAGNGITNVGINGMRTGINGESNSRANHDNLNLKSIHVNHKELPKSINNGQIRSKSISTLNNPNNKQSNQHQVHKVGHQVKQLNDNQNHTSRAKISNKLKKDHGNKVKNTNNKQINNKKIRERTATSSSSGTAMIMPLLASSSYARPIAPSITSDHDQVPNKQTSTTTSSATLQVPSQTNNQQRNELSLANIKSVSDLFAGITSGITSTNTTKSHDKSKLNPNNKSNNPTIKSNKTRVHDKQKSMSNKVKKICSSKLSSSSKSSSLNPNASKSSMNGLSNVFSQSNGIGLLNGGQVLMSNSSSAANILSNHHNQMVFNASMLNEMIMNHQIQQSIMSNPFSYPSLSPQAQMSLQQKINSLGSSLSPNHAIYSNANLNGHLNQLASMTNVSSSGIASGSNGSSKSIFSFPNQMSFTGNSNAKNVSSTQSSPSRSLEASSHSQSQPHSQSLPPTLSHFSMSPTMSAISSLSNTCPSPSTSSSSSPKSMHQLLPPPLPFILSPNHINGNIQSLASSLSHPQSRPASSSPSSSLHSPSLNHDNHEANNRNNCNNQGNSGALDLCTSSSNASTSSSSATPNNKITN